MADIDVSAYAHSSAHKAVMLKDYDGLKEIVSALPRLGNPFEITTEAASLAEEEKANVISAVVNRRDVPNGDTPLHLAAKLGDAMATDILMVGGATPSLKNKQGWSALREAIINKQDKIAMIMIKHSWNDIDAKWNRRLPRYVGALRRMRDFYMEITFHFESSVIPFISRIAPSDTYRIWKKGGNMRADMTLAGFDGLKIKRSDQSILFHGDGVDDGKKIPGSLCIMSHKKKEVYVPYLTPEPSKPTDREIRQTFIKKSRDNEITSVGIDVSQALLVPQLNWRRKEKKESVGPWKAKVYDMQNVVLSIKSRRVPGAPSESEVTRRDCNAESQNVDDILTPEERKQLEAAINNSSDETGHGKNNAKKEKKGRSGGHKEKEHHKGKNTNNVSSVNSASSSSSSNKDENGGREFRKGMMPSLWLSQNFPLKIEEFFPLLDILAEKVKAVRRLRELLTTKLPNDAFPVKVAIPVVSTVRVLVTFTKFEEIQHVEDEFESAPSSPSGEPVAPQPSLSSSSSSWFQWSKSLKPSSTSSAGSSSSFRVDDSQAQDLFAIPSYYTWTTFDAKFTNVDSNKPKAQNT